MTLATDGNQGLPGRLRRHLDRSRLLPPGCPVLVALSGGLDSVVLLHLLRFPLRDRVGTLAAAHLDHAMRPDSAVDALWAVGLCQAWDVPLTTERAHPPPRSEAEARAVRYAFLDDAAPPTFVIVTAHHADDQAETVLFRLARGAGLYGLRGIAPRRGRIVRPLLAFRRAELEAYATAARLPHRLDPTNLELGYARNRIRHRVLPELERARPGAARALAALAAQARRAEAAWEHVLAGVERAIVLETDARGITLARPALHTYHPHLQARLMRRLLRRYGVTPRRAGTRAALEFITSGPSGGSLDLRAGVRLERDFDRIRIVVDATGDDATGALTDEPLQITGPEAGRGQVVVAGRALEVWWGEFPARAATEGVTLPAPRFPLVFRRWQPGDRIRLGYGTKKLKKLLAEGRLDRRERARVPVLVDAEGEVLWVVGLARARGVGEAGKGFQIAVRDVG
jgi:tRNA(Ile)-lysidine synthase